MRLEDFPEPSALSGHEPQSRVIVLALKSGEQLDKVITLERAAAPRKSEAGIYRCRVQRYGGNAGCRGHMPRTARHTWK